jgi:hypothetical protein
LGVVRGLNLRMTTADMMKQMGSAAHVEMKKQKVSVCVNGCLNVYVQ